MDSPTSYDDDVYAWAYEQAALLRGLAATRRDLPNALDIEHLSEEIEGLARTDLREAESFMRLVLLHLLKLASAPDAFPVDHWKAEVAVFQADFVTLATRSILRKIEADKVWRLALGQATAQLTREGEAILPNLPTRSPFSPEEIAAASFDTGSAIQRLRHFTRAQG
jgi:hypothetical protein